VEKIDQKQDKKTQKRRDYDANKEEIIADYHALGEKQMLKKWGIWQATWLNRRKSGWVGLAVRWGLVEQPEPVAAEAVDDEPEAMASAAIPPRPEDVGSTAEQLPAQEDPHADPAITPMPGFPAFSDDWPEKVQLEWLRTYKEMHVGLRIADATGVNTK